MGAPHTGQFTDTNIQQWDYYLVTKMVRNNYFIPLAFNTVGLRHCYCNDEMKNKEEKEKNSEVDETVSF